MSEDLLQSLRSKVSHMNADPLARHRAPRIRLSEDAAWDPEIGSLRGSIEVVIDTENGKEALLLSEPLDGAVTAEVVDERLAEALSRALMDHAHWPK